MFFNVLNLNTKYTAVSFFVSLFSSLILRSGFISLQRLTKCFTLQERLVFRFSIFVVVVFQVYKVKVEHCGHWGVSQIPNWFIYRRYNDFADLHRQLIKHFPESGLGLPPKRWIGNNYDPVFIGHRIEGFNTFLKQILETSLTEIRDSSLVRDFLCLDSPPNRASSLSSCRVSSWLHSFICTIIKFI